MRWVTHKSWLSLIHHLAGFAKLKVQLISTTTGYLSVFLQHIQCTFCHPDRRMDWPWQPAQCFSYKAILCLRVVKRTMEA
jgi:hypothetical protein